MKRNQFAFTVICLLSAAHSLFAQNERLTLSKRVIKSGHWCSVSSSGLRSLHDGDTLVLHKKDRKHCTYDMNFKTGNRILLKEFTSRTYDGKPLLEFKTKGKWHITNNAAQFLVLDFLKSTIELELIDSKDDSMVFVVKNRKQKENN